MKAENYIIKAKLFRFKLEKEEITQSLRELIILIKKYFFAQGFSHLGPSDSIANFLELDFCLYLPNHYISKIKKFLGKDEYIQKQEHYFKRLRSKRDDFAGEIRILISNGNYQGKNGFFIEIFLKPIKYLKIVQLQESVEISQEKYSYIVAENQVFIKSFAGAIYSTIVEEPLPLSVFVKSEVSEKLKNYGFKRIGEILEKGKEKLEMGKDTESVDDLIGVIENFLTEILKRLGQMPKGLHQPEKNIQLLESKGYINSEMQGVLYGTLYNKIYQTLKNYSHGRLHFDLFDLRYFFDITEKSLDYLLEKIWKYKISTN